MKKFIQFYVCVSHSVGSDSATPWTVASQAPLSMEFSWQEYWSGLPCPSPGDLPDPGILPGSPALQADALPSELLGKSIHSIQTGKIVLTDKLQIFSSSRETADAARRCNVFFL